MNFVPKAYDFFRPHRNFFWAGIAGLVLVMAALVYFQGAMGQPKRTDVTVFVRAAQAVTHGENIYDVKTVRQWNYVYLPLLAVLFEPFARLPFWAVVMGWYALSVAMIFGLVFLAGRILDEDHRPYPMAFTACLFCLPVILHTLARGQLGIFSLFSAALVFYLYQRGRFALAGMILGFSVVIKISPLLFLLGFFGIKRQWRLCLSAALSMVFFIFLFPALRLGMERNLSLLKFWFETMALAVSPRAQESPLWAQLLDPYAEDNQSIFAVLIRLFLPQSLNFETGSAVYRLAARGLGGLFLAAAAALVFKNRCEKTPVRELTDFSFFPMVMLFASPASETHHYTLFYLPVLSALTLVQDARLSDGWRRAFILALAVSGGLFLTGILFNELNHYGAFVWGGLLLCGTLYSWRWGAARGLGDKHAC